MFNKADLSPDADRLAEASPGAVAVSAATGEWVDAAFVFLVLAINTALGGWQELQAESSARALRNTTRSTARIRRDGRVLAVDSSDIVVGDIVLLEAGDMTPADCRVLECASLKCDESSLTGESVPAEKSATDRFTGDVPLGDRENMLFSGCPLTNGRATAEKGLRMLDRRLADSEFIACERVTMADILAATGIDFARMVRFRPDPELVNVKRWLEAMMARPAARAGV